MQGYGPAEMAESFRTVRRNTIAIAEDCSDEQYSFRPTAGVRSVGEMLAHIAVMPRWQIALHTNHVAHVDFATFGSAVARAAEAERALATKADIVAALRATGDEFAAFLESLTASLLEERVTFPPPVQPASKTRFEMLAGVKEHEMHHRGQLMVYQRMLGIVPHLTRRREAMRAAAAGSPQS